MSPYRRVIEGIKKIFRSPAAAKAPSPPRPQSALQVRERVEHVPLIIPRAEHGVSRQMISKNALKVLYRLRDAGYQACLVGGGVRDVLLGRRPKDFDIATNAKPDEVRTLFRNCRLIGRRFRLAHVHFGEEIIEVATFRAHHTGDDDDEAGVIREGRILRDNVYGTFEEDAWRRDFTINSLYYNIHDFSVVDYTHQGMADLRAGIVRLIGDPIQRYREDPVRMLRAARFAAKLDFTVHPETEAPLRTLSGLLEDIPASRLFEEVNKLFLTGHARKSFQKLQEYGLFAQLFPQTALYLDEPQTLGLLEHALEDADRRAAEGKSVHPGFLFAAILWTPLQRHMLAYQAQGASLQESLQQASHEVVRQQAKRVALPKRFSLFSHDIWTLQLRLERPGGGKRALHLLSHPHFRAGYDFLLLRAKVEPELRELAEWWTRLHAAGPDERPNLLTAPSQPAAAKPKAKRRPRRRRRSAPAAQEAAPPASE